MPCATRLSTQTLKNSPFPSPLFLLVAYFQPGVYVTYNGDFFDWPFIQTRCLKHGIDLEAEIGFRHDPRTMECTSRAVPHLDW